MQTDRFIGMIAIVVMIINASFRAIKTRATQCFDRRFPAKRNEMKWKKQLENWISYWSQHRLVKDDLCSARLFSPRKRCSKCFSNCRMADSVRTSYAFGFEWFWVELRANDCLYFFHGFHFRPLQLLIFQFAIWISRTIPSDGCPTKRSLAFRWVWKRNPRSLLWMNDIAFFSPF